MSKKQITNNTYYVLTTLQAGKKIDQITIPFEDFLILAKPKLSDAKILDNPSNLVCVLKGDTAKQIRYKI